jgi:tripartite ATP-independent transporter DctP family solute receptor
MKRLAITKRIAITAAAACVAVSFGLGIVRADPMTLKFSYVDQDDPGRNPTAAYAYVFKQALEQYSGGQIKVELFPNGQLGDNASSLQQVRRGTIGVAVSPTGVLASLYYPQLGVVELPFLYDSRAHMRRVLSSDNPVIAKLVDGVAEKSGIRILSFGPYGFRDITTAKNPVREPADMKGLKIRTMEVVPHQEMMKAMGANPVPIPFLELYTSLQTGVVDGQENPPVNILQQKYYQVQKHVSLTNHLMTVVAIVVNDAWYKKLDPALKDAIRKADIDAELACAGVGAVQDTLALAELAKQGMSVYAPSPADLAKFRQATVAPTRAWAEKQYGADFVAAFYASLKN